MLLLFHKLSFATCLFLSFRDNLRLFIYLLSLMDHNLFEGRNPFHSISSFIQFLFHQSVCQQILISCLPCAGSVSKFGGEQTDMHKTNMLFQLGHRQS